MILYFLLGVAVGGILFFLLILGLSLCKAAGRDEITMENTLSS